MANRCAGIGATVANRIVGINPRGIIDRVMGLEEYLEDDAIARIRDDLFQGNCALSFSAQEGHRRETSPLTVSCSAYGA